MYGMEIASIGTLMIPYGEGYGSGWMRKATAFWEEWKGYGVGKAKWGSLKLCVWEIDGNLVEDERAGRGF